LIRLFYDNTKYRLRGSRKVLSLIEKVIRKENRISGDLNFIITDNENILKINREFLNHNYFTDVIAFEYGAGRVLDGEIYISYETVKINSINYNVSLKTEILRVMIHGTLHLCGYYDDTETKKLQMRGKENYWLKIFERRY